MSSENKVAMITGGSRGIGLGCAKELARNGFDLVINGRRPADQVSDVIEKLKEEHGHDVLYVQADIGSSTERKQMVEAVRKYYGRLDVLVNNAAMAPRKRADVLEADEDHFDDIFSVNLKGPYFLTQLVANWMIQQTMDGAKLEGFRGYRGCIINMASISSFVPSVNRGDYCMAKAALSMSTKLWATRLAEFGIGVFEIQPGVIETDMTSGVKEKYDKMIADGAMLLPRWGQPADIGRAVAMLARGELTYATGQVLLIDGGLTMPRL